MVCRLFDAKLLPDPQFKLNDPSPVKLSVKYDNTIQTYTFEKLKYRPFRSCPNVPN